MINNTLLNILAKFTPKEIKEFGEFVNSPFFNKNENVVKLYTYIRKFYPEFNDKRLEKEYVYRKIYSKGEYNDGFMRTVIFNLGKLAEDYIAYVNFIKDDLKRGINFLEELNERKLEKIFLKYFDEIEESVNDIQYKDAEYFYLKYQLQRQMEIYMDWSKFKNKDFKNYTTGINTYIDDDLTSFYLSRALNHYRFMLDKTQYEKIDTNFQFVNYLVDYLISKDNHFKDKLTIKLHLYEVLLETQKDEKYFHILKDLLVNEKDNLSHSDRYSLHNILQTYCVNMSYRGEAKVVKERFELYKICLEQKLYAASEHIYFDDLMFANIALNAISISEFEWADNFINEYKDKVSPENSDVVINYTYARLNFVKGEFSEALKFLTNIKTIKHIQFKLPIRDLTMMVYYELGMQTQAYYLIDSYRHFLTNNKESLSDTRYERINAFLKAFTRLVKIKEKNNQADLAKLTSELEENTNVQERKWLLAKVRGIPENVEK